MRKHVKLIVSVIAVLSMLVCAMVPAFAADSGKITATLDWNGMAVEADGVKTVTLENGVVSWKGLGEMNVQNRRDDGRTDAIGLGPVTKAEVDGNEVDLDTATIIENAKNAYIDFEITVDTAGTYTLALAYQAGSGNRVADVKVNDGDRIHLDVKGHDGWTSEYDDTAAFTAHLNKGTNHITFVNVEGFDNSNTKAINVIGLEWALKTADDNTGSGSATAPKTGFVTVALAVTAIGSGAYVVSKRKH